MSESTGSQRLLNLRAFTKRGQRQASDLSSHSTNPDARFSSRLERAVAGGWFLRYNRRYDRDMPVTFVEITAPDRRRLTIIDDAHELGAADGEHIVRFLLSDTLSEALRPQPASDGRSAEISDAVARTFQAGWDAAAQPLPDTVARRAALDWIQAAAENLPVETLTWWHARVEALSRYRVRGALRAREVRDLIAAGWTPELATPFFPLFRQPPPVGPEGLERLRSFAENRWKYDQVRTLEHVFFPQNPDPLWARIPAKRALLAAHAGLTAAETAERIAAGTFHVASVRALAGLRGIQVTP